MTVCLVFDAVAKEIGSSPAGGGPIWGRRIDDMDVVQVVSTTRKPGLEQLGNWTKSGGEGFKRPRDASVVLVVSSDVGNAPKLVAWVGGTEEPTEIVDFAKSFDRISSLLRMDTLRNKKVLVAGLGSGGSRVALELAKAGIGNLILVDSERLEIENVVRHMCGVSDLGRYKTRAVRDLLLDHNPSLKVDCYELDLSSSIDEYDRLIQMSDLVVAATGSTRINDITNNLCIRARVPAVFAGVWEKGSGGFVMRYVPDVTPCFNCVHGTLFQLEPSHPTSVDYSALSDSHELTAEPGLSTDIGFISLLQSKLSLLTLAADNSSSNPSQHMLVWLNRAEGNRPPLSLLKVVASRREDCLSCGRLSTAERPAVSVAAETLEHDSDS